MASDCKQSIDYESIYQQLRQNGVEYGKTFACIRKLHIGNRQAVGKVVIPNLDQCISSERLQPHTIHPTTFNALMHVVLPLYFRHCSAGPVMLTSIDEVSVAADMVSKPGSQLTVCCSLSPSGPRSGSVDVTAFQNGNPYMIPVVTLRGERFQGIGGEPAPSPIALQVAPFHNLLRPLKLSIGTPGVLNTVFFVEDKDVRAGPKPDEVEIKPLAFALELNDVDFIVGRGGDNANLGECAGVITAVGSDLKNFTQIGERVCCWNMNNRVASRTHVKATFVHKVPNSWSFATSAVLPKNMTIAYYGVRELSQVIPGQILLVQGAGSPLGHAAVIVANLLGVTTLATVRNQAERDVLLLLPGVESGNIFYSDGYALQTAIQRLTHGAGVAAVLNTSSTFLTEQIVATVAPFGSVVDILGHASHHSVLADVADRAIRYMSFSPAQLLRHCPSAASDAFKNVMSLLSDKNIEEYVPKITMSLADVKSAFQAIQGQMYTGKAVLLAEDDTLVSVREMAVFNQPAGLMSIIKAVNGLSVPQNQKADLIALINGRGALVESAEPAAALHNETITSHVSSTKIIESCLNAVQDMNEARQIILEEVSRKIASLVAMSPDSWNDGSHLQNLVSIP